MNKSIISAAIAAAMLAPVAAMAETKFYGELHVSYDILDADDGESRNSVSSNTSKVGIKGSTELNAGLKAIYQAEFGIDTGGANNDEITKTSKAAFANRNQFVGLAGGFGAVLVGRHDTPFKTVGRKADLFWSTQLGQNYAVTNPGNWDLRPNNVVAYQTPKMGGFQALAAYVTDLGEVGGFGDDDNTAISVNGLYNAGPLMLGAGYEKHNLDGLSADRNAFRLVGSYKVGEAKVVGFYQDEENDGIGGPDATVWGIGGAYDIGAGTIKGQYYERDLDGTGDDPALIAVGYDHNLGKKTIVYGQYATISEGGKLAGVGHDESITSPTGGDADGFSIGLKHSF